MTGAHQTGDRDRPSGGDGLAVALTDVLGRLPAGAVLQLVDAAEPDGDRYVQLWQDPAALRVEVGAAAPADPARGLPAVDPAVLAGIGWQPPGPAHPAHWWAELAWPAPAAGYQRLAYRLVDTIRDAFGLAIPAGLGYRAWRAGAGPLDLPELGLAPVRTQYWARLADGDPVDRPAGLLRRTRVGAVTTDEAFGRDGRWHPTRTVEYAERGELLDDLVPLDEPAAGRLVAQWRDRAAATADGTAGDGTADGGVRVASTAEVRRDPGGRPVLPEHRLPPGERAAVAGYLRDAPIVLAGFGYDPDPYDPEQAEVVPLHLHTDGVWVWSESLAYFAERYGLPPEPDFLAHLRRQGHRCPEVDEAALRRAEAALRR
ncbi:TY-Chap domain-containing protein [Micromonospora echinofusca]|uniref:TY-Chap N-terminal domain-containing protein n=1 Tax=Micromonospora echinofusca TaxID=47858 RepID=A0ABS3VVN1_MICEH|nr:hypothetical protein [Micromonospora echinofusca]MBO4208612.1 hypothetical protein [Micromonospora echinofusca]